MTENAPLLTSWQDIEPEWIDHNDHLNMGYYTVVFDRATDEVFRRLGFGPPYIRATQHTTFTAEFHTRYLSEVKLGDRVRSTFWMLDHDEKRFHTFQELYREDGTLAATGEGMTLHVSLDGPRVAPLPGDIQTRISDMARDHAAYPRPDGIGSVIGIRRKG